MRLLHAVSRRFDTGRELGKIIHLPDASSNDGLYAIV